MDHTELKAQYACLCGYYRDRQYDQALALLDDLLAHFPDNPTLVYSQALALASAKRYDEAVVRCDRLIREFHDVRGVELRALIAASEADEQDSSPLAQPEPEITPSALEPGGLPDMGDSPIDPLADDGWPIAYIDPLADEPEVPAEASPAEAPFGSSLPTEDTLHETHVFEEKDIEEPVTTEEAVEEPIPDEACPEEPIPDTMAQEEPGEIESTIIDEILAMASDERPPVLDRPKDRRLMTWASLLIMMAVLAAVLITALPGPPVPVSPATVASGEPVLAPIGPTPPIQAAFPDDQIHGFICYSGQDPNLDPITILRGSVSLIPDTPIALTILPCHDLDLALVGELLGETVSALHIEHPDLDEEACKALSLFPKVEKLELNDAALLTDSALAQIAGMANLKYLTIRGALLLTDTALTPLAGIQGIMALDLAETSLTDASAEMIAGFKTIETLAMPSGATAASLPALAKLPALVSLRLGPMVSGDTLSALGSLSTLRELRLDATGLGAELAPLQRLTALESFTFTGVPDETLWDVLATLPSLRTLRIVGCVPPSGFLANASLAQLENLMIEAAPVDDGGIALLREVAAMPALTACSFTNTPVTNEAILAFKDHPRLQHLGLAGTAISYSPPDPAHTGDNSDPQFNVLQIFHKLQSADVSQTLVEPFTDVLRQAAWLPSQSLPPDGIALFPRDGLKGLVYAPDKGMASVQNNTIVDQPFGYPRGAIPYSPLIGLLLELDADALESLDFASRLPFRSVRNLHLMGKTLRPGVAAQIGQFRGLESLRLHLTELEPETLDQITLEPGLSFLSLENTPIHEAWLARLPAQTPMLHALTLSGSGITDDVLATLSSFHFLHALNLSGCPVGDAVVRALAASQPELESLNLAHSKVTDEGARSLRVLFKLKSLDLTETAVTETERAALALALPECQMIPPIEATPAQ